MSLPTPATVDSTRSDPPPADVAESILWQGGPSQWIGFRTYFVTAILIGLIVAAAWAMNRYTSWNIPWTWPLAAGALGLIPAIVRWTAIASVRYTLTTQRLLTTTGMLTQRTDELELYRVRDSFLLRPIWGRLLNYGHITLKTSDLSSPELVLVAVPKPQLLHDRIRQQVEAMRQLKQVHELDVSPRNANTMNSSGASTL